VRLCGASGPKPNDGTVGPKIVTVGTPMAEARCCGAESFVTSAAHRPISSADASSGRRPVASSAAPGGTASTIACSGAATLVVEPTGKNATGTADCIISFNGYDLPATYSFDLDNDDGELSGVANADIGGFYELPFDATGRLDRNAGTMEIAFSGDVFGMMTIDATVDTERVSLDAGL
jgi:hypothetical protein